MDQNEILNQIVTRDTRDASRAVGPLSIPHDAEVIDTTKLSEAQVVELMAQKIASKTAAERVT